VRCAPHFYTGLIMLYSMGDIPKLTMKPP